MARDKKSGICSICLREGEKTEWHHIISQSRVNKLKPNEHNYNNDLINNSNNMIELCLPCHWQTDSNVYRRWMLRNDNSILESDVPSIALRMKGKTSNQCLGVTTYGNRCRVKSRHVPRNGYCKSHANQAPLEHFQNPDNTDYIGELPTSRKEWRAKKYQAEQALRRAKWKADGTFQCAGLKRGKKRCNVTVYEEGGKCHLHTPEGIKKTRENRKIRRDARK